MAVTATGPLGSLAPVPMAGLSWVSVHPDHRRRGVLRAMITHHFAQLHEQGAALSGLHAAEVQIYDNFGYGIGSVELLLKLERGAVFNAPNLDAAASKVTTRLIDRCERPRGGRSPPAVARRPAGGRRQELRLLVAATGRRGHGPRGARLLRREHLGMDPVRTPLPVDTYTPSSARRWPQMLAFRRAGVGAPSGQPEPR